ncbi:MULTISPECIES: AAA family ATPase [Brevundimonas]|uniref:AAA family ATPase n=1 Tax=Brevundimonas sp. UBA7507 TaxID=1946137 RepID=UPI00257AFDEE|nr:MULTISPECIES: AAA family ATPase [Brevundimonas]
MPTKVQQVVEDGSVVVDFDPPQVPFEEQELIIRDALRERGWDVDFKEANKASRRRAFVISKGGVSFRIITYIFSNFAWSNGKRSHAEKRIQLSRDYEEHASDFELDKAGDPRCAVMGIYRRDKVTLFGAWDASAYKGHKNPSSCYIRVPAMSAAQRNGFSQGVDQNERLVCCFTPDMLAYYLENMKFLHEHVSVTQDLIRPAPEDEGRAAEVANSSSAEMLRLPDSVVEVPDSLPHNRIIYGAPGTGKSHRLDDDLSKYFPTPALYERTTFYPDTTNGAFVGEYRPVPVYRRSSRDFIGPDRTTTVDSLEPLIDYRFVPGPFLRVLVRALKHPEHNFAVVIEEINRAHASAVFGEVFQLLDRTEDGAGRFSVVLSPAAQDYLESQGVPGSVRIPKNLYIWATMNSADQGVLPMDAAFRRRWSLEYVGIDEGEAVVEDWEIKVRFRKAPVKWNILRRAINKHLQNEGVPEDRLIGPFFMTKKELSSDSAFENKLLQYLRDDVVRSAPNKLFSGSSLTYGALVAQYRAGESIFVSGVDLGGDE